MQLRSTDAEQIALDFLMQEWNISDEYRNWFKVVGSRLVGQIWYTVEITIEGYPDKWFIQVYDTFECDPCYTFVSPVSSTLGYTDLDVLPDLIAEVLVSERNSR